MEWRLGRSITEGIDMGFGEKLREAMERLRKATFVDKGVVKEVVKEIQRALIASDVEIGIVLELSKKVEEEAMKKLPEGTDRRAHVIKAVYELLVGVLGGEKTEVPQKPGRILLVGLFGSGKTTASAKLAGHYMKRGMKVGMICADTARPAAYEQLEQLAGRIKVAFYGNPGEKKAWKIVREGMERLKGVDLVIVDSAGRNALDRELEREIKEINAELKPDLTLLVLSADIGQVARKQAAAFHNAVGVNGVMITKIDGSAKGGGALAACSVTKAPVYFIGTGEKVADIEEFDAQRYLARVMGYGDLAALLARAKEVAEEEEISPEEMMKQEFTLEAFYQQLKAARKMGSLGKVVEMMGLGSQIPREQLEVGEEKLEAFRVIMDSMTRQEKREPELLNRSRIERVAKGSGRTEAEVRELIKQYKAMKGMFKKFRNIDEKKLKKQGLQGLLQGLKLGKRKKFKIR